MLALQTGGSLGGLRRRGWGRLLGCLCRELTLVWRAQTQGKLAASGLTVTAIHRLLHNILLLMQ